MSDIETVPVEFKFVGFPEPEQNYSKLPHVLIDALPQMRSEAEVKCVLYILRHTWGFSEYDEPKHMTLDEFQNGRKRRDGTRIDGGTGLTKPSVIKGLRAAEKHGFIKITFGDTSDGGRIEKLYQLAMRKQPLPQQSTALTPEVKNLYPSEELDVTGKDSLQVAALMGKDSLPRTEKETIQKETKESAADAAPKPRKRRKKPTIPAEQINPMKDAIHAAFKYPAWSEMTTNEKGKINAAAKQLCAAGKTPADVPVIYKFCESKYDNFTPLALASHANEALKSKNGSSCSPAHQHIHKAPERLPATNIVSDEEFFAARRKFEAEVFGDTSA